MKAGRIARWIGLFLLALVFQLGVSSLLAVDSTGVSPTDALGATCNVKSLDSGAKVWYKIPYHTRMELEIDLTVIDGVNFEVFAPDQVRNWPAIGQATGQGTPSPSDPIYLKTWQGHLVQSDYVLDYYYILVTNTLQFEVQYQLCTTENKSSLVEPMEDKPTGDSPDNGLTAPCTLQFLGVGAQLWHKVQYHRGKQLELYLRAKLAGIDFDVFTPEQARNWPFLGQPIGRGTPNRNEPEYSKSWEGHLMQSDYYYILVTNTNAVEAQYQLCLVEKDFGWPTFTPTPSPTPPP